MQVTCRSSSLFVLAVAMCGCQDIAMTDFSECTQVAMPVAPEDGWPLRPDVAEGRWEVALDGVIATAELHVTSASWTSGWERWEWTGEETECPIVGLASGPYREVTADVELSGIPWSRVEVQVSEDGEVRWASWMSLVDYEPGASASLDAMLLAALPSDYGTDIVIEAAMLNFEGRVGEPTGSFHGQVSATGSARRGTESVRGTLTALP